MPRIWEHAVDMPIRYETKYLAPGHSDLWVADRFRSDRVLIAHDAAHLVIPTEGGMNPGDGDAIGGRAASRLRCTGRSARVAGAAGADHPRCVRRRLVAAAPRSARSLARQRTTARDAR
jgi:FAD binding domain